MSPGPQRKLLDHLRARGIRLTSQRAVLVNILDSAEDFVDVPTLCAMAKRRGARVDRATVYRTLALLRAQDLLSPGNVGRESKGAGKAARIAQDELGLVCEQCGAPQPVTGGTADSIKRELQRCTGFDARVVRLEASGECRLCAAKARLHSRVKGKAAL